MRRVTRRLLQMLQTQELMNQRRRMYRALAAHHGSHGGDDTRAVWPMKMERVERWGRLAALSAVRIQISPIL